MTAVPTIKDVARVAGVSIGTVSNVLNRPDGVRPAYRAKVEAAITELGYVPDETARNLRKRRPASPAAAASPYVPTLARRLEDSTVSGHR